MELWDGERVSRAVVIGRRWVPPAHLNLEDDAEETLKFFERIRALAARPNVLRFWRQGSKPWVSPPGPGRRYPAIRSYFDYSAIRSISTSAALILTAEYARARELTRMVPPTIDLHAWNPGVFSTLFEVGFFAEVGLSRRAEEQYLERGNVRTIPILSGTNAHELKRASEAILELAPFLGGAQGLPHEVVVEMNTAIGEGLANVSGWAYPEEHAFKYMPVNRWWLTAAANRDEATLTISLYDQGATIPVTFARPTLSKILTDFFSLAALRNSRSGPDDGTYIEGAMRFGASGTGHAHRGQGLPQMSALIDFCGGGSLTVLSRRGRCRYEHNGQIASDSMGTSVGGTLVEWKLVVGR